MSAGETSETRQSCEKQQTCFNYQLVQGQQRCSSQGVFIQSWEKGRSLLAFCFSDLVTKIELGTRPNILLARRMKYILSFWLWKYFSFFNFTREKGGHEGRIEVAYLRHCSWRMESATLMMNWSSIGLLHSEQISRMSGILTNEKVGEDWDFLILWSQH